MSETPSPSPALSPVAPSRGRAVFYVAVIFLAGAIVGSALTIGIGRRVIQRGKDPATWNVETMRRLDRHLELSPAQRERMRPILIDMTARMRESRAAARREWATILQDTRDRLRAELTPEQQVEFDQLAAHSRENLGRFLGAPPEPGTHRAPPSPNKPPPPRPKGREQPATPPAP